jgi:transcriptional regulator with XRE-family HTH domain
MALRVKEIAKARGMSMGDLAERMGISPVTLSQSLNRNPTLGRLTEVANILEVDVADLFSPRENVHGCLFVNGKAVVINSKEELFELVEKIR